MMKKVYIAHCELHSTVVFSSCTRGVAFDTHLRLSS